MVGVGMAMPGGAPMGVGADGGQGEGKEVNFLQYYYTHFTKRRFLNMDLFWNCEGGGAHGGTGGIYLKTSYYSQVCQI